MHALIPVVLKVIVFLGPKPLMPQITDEIGKWSDAVMISWDTITVIPGFSMVTLTRVAYVVGIVTLVTFTLLPTLYICISSPSVPMCSSLRHSSMVEFLVTHVNIILCWAYARFPLIKVLFSLTSWRALTVNKKRNKCKQECIIKLSGQYIIIIL